MSQTTTDAKVRATFINGFRALAEFTGTHPELPLPLYSFSNGLTVFAGGSQAEQRTEAGRIAEILDVPPYEWGLYQAERRFCGPVVFRVVAVPETGDEDTASAREP
jgi:hypothetical protein